MILSWTAQSKAHRCWLHFQFTLAWLPSQHRRLELEDAVHRSQNFKLWNKSTVFWRHKSYSCILSRVLSIQCGIASIGSHKKAIWLVPESVSRQACIPAYRRQKSQRLSLDTSLGGWNHSEAMTENCMQNGTGTRLLMSRDDSPNLLSTFCIIENTPIGNILIKI